MKKLSLAILLLYSLTLYATDTYIGNNAVPAGGNSNQILSKNSATDYDMSWKTVSSVGGMTSLTGDVTGTGPGATATTVALVGGSTAANVHQSQLDTAAATNANTASTIVKRDGSGGFSMGALISSALRATGLSAAGLVQNDTSGNLTTLVPGTKFNVPMSTGTAFTSQPNPGSGDKISWYVDVVNGSDTNDGSLMHPFKTLNKGCQAFHTTFPDPNPGTIYYTSSANDTEPDFSCDQGVNIQGMVNNGLRYAQISANVTIVQPSPINDTQQTTVSNLYFAGNFTYDASANLTGVSALTCQNATFNNLIYKSDAGASGGFYGFGCNILAGEIKAGFSAMFGGLLGPIQVDAGTTMFINGMSTAGFGTLTMIGPVSVQVTATPFTAVTCTNGGGAVSFSYDAASVPAGAPLTGCTSTFLDDATNMSYTPSAPTAHAVVPTTIQGGLDGLQFVQQSAVGSQPTCVVGLRGLAWLVQGGTGVADIYQVCQHTAANTYLWITH